MGSKLTTNSMNQVEQFESVLKDCDHKTLSIIRHLLAGRANNLIGCAKMIESGKTTFQSGKPVIDSLLSDAKYINDLIAALPFNN